MTQNDNQQKQNIENRFNENNKIFRERNEKGTKENRNGEKERNLDFLSPIKKILFIFFLPQKEN